MWTRPGVRETDGWNWWCSSPFGSPVVDAGNARVGCRPLDAQAGRGSPRRSVNIVTRSKGTTMHRNAQDTARLLWTCRKSGTVIDALSAALRSHDTIAGHAIQAALADVASRPVVNWKITATCATGPRQLQSFGAGTLVHPLKTGVRCAASVPRAQPVLAAACNRLSSYRISATRGRRHPIRVLHAAAVRPSAPTWTLLTALKAPVPHVASAR